LVRDKHLENSKKKWSAMGRAMLEWKNPEKSENICEKKIE